MVGDQQAVVLVTVAEFDRLISADIDAAVGLTRRTLQASGVAADQLHALYLTGGSSHLPLVSRRIADLLGSEPATLNDPKLVVALGALTVPGGPSRGAAWPPVPVGRTFPGSPGPAVPPSRQRPAPTPTTAFAAPTGADRPTAPRPPVPPTGPTSTPSTPVRSRRSLLVGGAALAVIAIAVTVFLILRSGDSPDQAGDVPTTSGGVTVPPVSDSGPAITSGPITSGPVTSEGVTSEEVTSDAVTSDPSAPINCWNGDVVEDSSRCPKITGSQGLQWVFAHDDAVDPPTCEESQVELLPTVEESYVCTFEDLPLISVYLTRWTEVGPAAEQIESYTGTQGRQRAEDGTDDSKRMDGLQWGPTTLDDGSRIFAFTYNSLPFAVEMLATPASESEEDRSEAATQMDEALDRQFIGFADIVEARGRQ